MKLSERLLRTSWRQRTLGRSEVSDWYLLQHRLVVEHGPDRDHPPLRGVIERYQAKKGFSDAP